MKFISILINILIKFLFLALFIGLSYYILFIESEKYEAQSVVMVTDLSQKQSVSALGSLLLGSTSKGMQDAKLLEVYIKSHEMYNKLDKEFNLTAYYTSEEIDPLNRLYDFDFELWMSLNKNNLLNKYVSDLNILYDEPSSTLSIAYAHVDAKLAQKVVNNIVHYAGVTLNKFEKENTKIVLKFLEKQEQEKYKDFLFSLNKLLNYQSRKGTIDPKIDIASKNTILASLEAELVQKKVVYNSKLQYLNPNSPEMTLSKGNISYLKKSIAKIKKELTSKKGKKALTNVDLSDFTLLSNEVEFKKELYRQVLIKLEETAFSIQQNSKNLIVVSHAEVADSYAYPHKIKDILTYLIVIFFLYGITNLVITLMKEHKD